MLRHDRTGCHLVAVAEVPDSEADEIAAAQLAVDAKVEQGELAYTALHLQADAQCPDVLELERCLLPNDLALVPRLAMDGIGVGSHDGLHQVEGSTRLNLPKINALAANQGRRHRPQPG